MYKKHKFSDIFKQYRITHYIDDDKTYKQVTISKNNTVSFRGTEIGSKIGRKRQFIVDLNNFPHTLLFTRQGVADGSIGLAPYEINQAIVTENMPMFEVLTDKINPEYLSYYLKSEVFKESISKLVPLGTAQKSIHERDLMELEIYLPSLEEQNDQVNKLNIIIKSLNELNEEICTQEVFAKQLKDSILLKAVQGKLVKQNDNDEPTDILLKEITSQKEKLIKDKKMKKGKILPEIKDEEKPFELPPNWKWIRLGAITQLITSGSRDWAKYYSPKGAKFVRMGNLSRNSFELKTNNIQLVQPPLKGEGSRTKLEPNDILVSITGEVGLLGLIPVGFGEAYINQHTAVVRLHSSLEGRFYPYAFLSSLCQKQFNGPQRGIKNSFRLTDLEHMLIPLPPLNEQKRIVEKIDQLMTQCKELENNIVYSKQETIKLQNVILKQTFTVKEELYSL